MKKLICYWQTIKQFDTFINVFFGYGAIYIAHDYREISEKLVRSKNRIEHKLKCKRCGEVSISWRQL